jgi:ATP-binding cassette subfamily F protein 3
MSLITVTNLSKAFGAHDIFSGLSFGIPRHARIGLVGANGIGKTTLLRILMGLEEASGGTVQKAKGIRIGFLQQEATFETENTLWGECLTAFKVIRAQQTELNRLEHLMSQSDHSEETMAEYGNLQHEFDLAGGYTYDTKIHQTLTGLGFNREEEQRPVSQLSGGQRTRARLAILLLENPDLLLMDEPTNHLDITAVEWLEDYLGEWQGATLTVSHDRYFLNRAVKSIWEMTPALEIYHGNYTAFLQQRAERYERRLEEYQKQQEFIERQEDYIRKNIAGQNSHQAKGRLRRLERLLSDSKLARPTERRKLSLRLQPVDRSGDLVLRTYDLQVGYHDEGHPLFNSPNLVLRRTECAAVLGPNGAGKTTFLKTILEQIPPYSGTTELGGSLKVGYFAQAHEGLHQDWTLMQEIEALAPKMLPGEIRNYLATFLFSGDDVFMPVSSLSGGERGRLALACLALQGANLLLLDEPTNHLDLQSQDVLQGILSEYKGTILLVSHDRYLIDALATQIWEVSPEERSLRVFLGTYSEYRASRQQEALKLKAPQETRKPREKKATPKGLSKDQLRKRKEKLDGLEEEIAQHERDLEMISRQLETTAKDSARVYTLGQEYVSVQRLLDESLNEWEKLSEELEKEEIGGGKT